MTNDYRLILACYRSGQVSEAQWQAHMKDEVFAAWVRKATTPDASGGPAAPGNRP